MPHSSLGFTPLLNRKGVNFSDTIATPFATTDISIHSIPAVNGQQIRMGNAHLRETTETTGTCKRSNRQLRNRIQDARQSEYNCWLTGRKNKGSSWNLSLTKRLIDSSIAAIALALISPLMLCIAILIKLTSKGPVFFYQKRTGYMGRRFNMFKFRTMVNNAEALKAEIAHLNQHENSSPDFKAKNDPRITKIGAFLRKYSLDELPQFLNVLNGDMRLVGPRPTSFCASTYEPHHLTRLAAYPGLTGIWQISGRSNIGFDGRVKLDEEYIAKQGPLSDLIILLKTPLTVIKGDGAY